MVSRSGFESTGHGLVPWLHAEDRKAICELEGAFEGEQDFLQLAGEPTP
jgi:hypothetical protein